MDKVNQIYHVARCGSTLLTSLLSTVTTAYSESSWSKSLLLGVDPYKNIQSVYGSVVKFPSMVSCYPKDFPGEKVFLYRPLAQHLCKMKSVDPLWIKSRLKTIDYIFKNYNHPKLSEWKSKNDLDKITYMWLCSVFRMLDDPNILWIRTNDFLREKQKTLEIICNHFNLSEVTDLSLSDINVKKSGLNSKDIPINHKIKEIDYIEYVLPSYGIIETDLALYDEDIKTRVKTIENMYPQLGNLLY
jgi:hypothetical protein